MQLFRGCCWRLTPWRCFRAPGWTISDAPLRLLLTRDPRFQMMTFSASSCVLSPTGWRSSEFLHPPSHSRNRTDQECCGIFFFLFLGMTRWRDFHFKMKRFYSRIDSIPDSCLSEWTWQRSSETPKNCLSVREPQNNAKTDGGLLKPFECYVFFKERGKFVTLSRASCPLFQCSFLPVELWLTCLLWRLASSHTNKCSECLSERSNAAVQGCRQTFELSMLHKKKSLVGERLQFCRCSVCVYSVKSEAFFHLRPHKQQKLKLAEHFLGNKRPPLLLCLWLMRIYNMIC